MAFHCWWRLNQLMTYHRKWKNYLFGNRHWNIWMDHLKTMKTYLVQIMRVKCWYEAAKYIKVKLGASSSSPVCCNLRCGSWIPTASVLIRVRLRFNSNPINRRLVRRETPQEWAKCCQWWGISKSLKKRNWSMVASVLSHVSGDIIWIILEMAVKPYS